ncbi:AAA family ATPase [Salinibacter sp.]|uniref:AAA family ATPase n=1 Tax=Salinibacter sp. TaxID=2065818 RepID=UPI0021E8690E|nr:AAA family ATPase [Salinibacter sp.]
MIFESLELNNFRQFSETQSLRFASKQDNNVTVIHGYNGSGKTTLLNAFVWLFYGSFTPDFTDTDRLVNEGEWEKIDEGEDIEVSVKGVFRHDGQRFVAKRKKVVEKLAGDGAREVKTRAELDLSYVDDDGELKSMGGPQDAMEQILPKTLYPFFFFNGERIEQLASPQAYERVENGIKVLLDIELLERAIRHLSGQTANDLRDEITKHSGLEGEKVRKERAELADTLEELNDEREQKVKNRGALEDERDRIDQKLREQPELADLQRERDEKRERLESIKGQIRDAKENLADAVSEDGYVPLTSSILSEALDLLDDAHEEGELPPPLKRQFVDELLERGECICGRSLEEGSEHRKKVEAWLEKTSSEEIATIATTTRAEINKTTNKRKKKFHRNLDKYQNKRNDLNEKKRRLEERLSQISSEIGDEAPEEDYKSLENRRRKIQDNIETINIEIAEADREIGEVENKIEEKDEEIKTIKQESEKGEVAQRRLEAVENVASALEEIRQLQKQSVREDLSDSLQEVWGDISIKDYDASLDSEYRLQLTKTVGGNQEPVRGASTGEKQVLSLAFVSSLVRKASDMKSNGQASGSGLFTGGEYPLVMDSPFGSLEKEYRRQVADWVPELAPQIVAIVSETQWRKEVEEELGPKIGREWILECHTPKHRSKDIELHGREYPYVAESKDGFERTVINEVDVR